MATLTHRLIGLLVQKPVAEPRRVVPAEDIYRLRALPNEHIHFYMKTIDNGHVRREVDKRSQSIGWKSIGSGGLAAIIAIVMLLPVSLTIQAGYQLSALKLERQTFLRDRSELMLEEARILSPESLVKLARLQDFIDPDQGKIVYLNPPGDTALAMKAKQRDRRE